MATEGSRFEKRLAAAEAKVAKVRLSGEKRALADALRELGNIQRRPPELREAANRSYAESAELYRELGSPLDRAWVIRHIGIDHEYAGRLTEAEHAYEEALDLYRENSKIDDLDYANAVRYAAVIKDRLEKCSDAETLWEEAVSRYEALGIIEGVAEGTGHLTLFAMKKGDLKQAEVWFARAKAASSQSNDHDTHKFIDEVTQKLLNAGAS